MRKSVITGVVLGIVLLGAAPALAAPPEVSQKNCDAAGGSFDRDHGVKTCTTTSVDTVTSEGAGPKESMGPVAGVTAEFTGTVRETTTVQTTTTQTQKGNGDVTTASTGVLLSFSRQWLTCHVEVHFLGTTSSRNVDPDVCAHPQNYPLDGFFA